MGRVLVTSASTRVAYCIGKSLSRRGLQVVMADTDPLAMSFWSRHVFARHRYASPFHDEGHFIEDLERIIEKEQIDVLIPVLEETYFVARNRERLAPRVHLFLAAYPDLIRLHDKHSLAATAKRLGVRMPRTMELTEVISAGMPADFGFPAVLKPKQGGGGWSVRELAGPDELARAISEFQDLADRYLVQEKIDGPIVGVAMLYRNGRMVAADSYRTLQTYPHPYGQPTIRLSRDFPEDVASLKRILDDVKWEGPCQADFLHRKGSDEGYLIDVNPRFWGSVGQSIARGIDFPYYYYQCAMGEADVRVPENPPAVATRWLGGDLMRKARNLFARDGAPERRVSDVSLPEKFAAMDDFDLTDPLPFIGWCVSQATRKARAFAGFGNGREALDGVWK